MRTAILPVLWLALACASTVPAPPETHRVRTERDVKVPMRDGVELSTNLHFPEGVAQAPVILLRTPYGKMTQALVDRLLGRIEAGSFFASHGYITVVQDCRGRYDSGGVYYPFVNEAEDGQDTIAWIEKQPWFSGRLGTFGSSYVGVTQWFEAPGREIDAMHLNTTSASIGRALYRGGQLHLLTALFWATLVGDRSADVRTLLKAGLMEKRAATLPVSRADDRMSRDVGYYNDFVDFRRFSEMSERVDYDRRYREVVAPAVLVAGWYDMFLGPQLDDFNRLIREGQPGARSSVLIVGPWSHGLEGGDETVDFGPGTSHREVIDEAHLLAWFDARLRARDTVANRWPPVRIFVMGDNVWRDEAEWPLARTRYTRYYLHSRGQANTRAGNGLLSPQVPVSDEPSDTFTYDPLNPVPTLGGSNLGFNLGAYDQSPVEDREDVLCYTTPPLTSDLEVTGPITAVLYAATDAVDTDFTMKLVDVHPNGTPVNIQDGIVRAKFRDGDPNRPTPVQPGRVEKYEIDLWATSIVFKAGHRIRVEVSSSNFPRFNRNLNTGEPVPHATRAVIANQTIHHDASYPSHIILPVIPR